LHLLNALKVYDGAVIKINEYQHKVLPERRHEAFILRKSYSGTTLLYKIKVVAWIIIFVLCCLFCITTPIIRRYINQQQIQYCTAIVASSRPLEPIGSTGDECWLKLSKGVPAELMFNEPAQTTYGTSTSGNDSFFFIAKKGDKLSNVTGATIRCGFQRNCGME
jgi:hypothetical protein